MLARVPLWREGLEYHHGTGHGVGSFLNVHESGSIYGFAPRAAPDMLALQPSMVITNEPGYYEEGNFGVRHENVYLVSPCAQETHWNLPGGTAGGNERGTNGFNGGLAPEEARENSNSQAEFLKFEPFTRSPIQTKIVMPELLTAEQLSWLNDYNGAVRDALLPVYEATPPERYEQWQVTKEQMIAFLIKETAPVEAVTPAKL